MAIDIAAQVTAVWPTTEAKLLADADADYAANKLLAIGRAKVALYGANTVPDEADLPDLAGYWIADQAVVFLMPVARDYYMLKQRVSDNKDGMSITYYNVLNALDNLRNELLASLRENKATALEAVSSALDDFTDVPVVSTAGQAVDPMARAMLRGPLLP